jgi:hypothetical protein
MVLRGWLSNRELAASLHSLTVALRDQAGTPTARGERFTYARDRRRFGTVGNAIVDVLAEAGEPMKLQAIHEAVERKLAGVVSLNTVHDYLLRRAKGSQALFERPSHGHYRLRSSSGHADGCGRVPISRHGS